MLIYNFCCQCKVYLQRALCYSANLTIHIGNDVRVAGLYLTDIMKANMLKGYDQDVVIGGDVWILQVYWLLSQFFHIIYVLVYWHSSSSSMVN